MNKIPLMPCHHPDQKLKDSSYAVSSPVLIRRGLCCECRAITKVTCGSMTDRDAINLPAGFGDIETLKGGGFGFGK
ncbi:hypothetical protein TELCIR_16330 [Teladorsagia circumcincta]|uniref:Uncharacterized protein n=1 Tax=Teladorsagia circumcincta TaxID=45464 RepID=A0A2G9TW12_TELCI|nr:hypothetical protein TELCIR_16330 [Teladorsagia circumcincta]